MNDLPPSKRKLQKNEDWDIPYYEYLWCSVLNRSIDEFYKLTPKKLFLQIDKFAKYNNPSKDKDEKKKETVYLNQGTQIGKN
ncbi:MAG: hypothetical protein J6J36_00520 [Clostridia bacterium]|nr:hypothetical protein [Clostridia bacterium]